MAPWHRDLNPEQREAVTHVDGPLLILAGAGSGKTRVITHRIAYLVREAGVPPESILAVTFTNKAAAEMARRVEGLLGLLAHEVWISTFHAAGVRILRRDGHRIGLPPNLVIYDDADQRALVKRILKEMNLDEGNFPPRAILAQIDAAKGAAKGPDDLEVEAWDVLGQKSREVYRRYQAALRAAGAVDFGDLLLEPLRLFRQEPEVLERYRRRLRYVMVDEFQDTNAVQYALLRLLVGERGNLAVVGDDDQSIYRWRGADIRNILSFERDFPAAKVVRLERNYRSSQRILDAAYAVIRRNPRRKEKRLWTERAGGDPIEVHRLGDEQTEAAFVARRIAALREDFPLKEMAVFYRVNAQSRVLEDALRTARIPYQVVRGRSFYERAEIKDAVAYLRLAVNPHSDADFLRVVNTPRRGIGKRTIEALSRAAARSGRSLFGAVAAGAPVEGLSAAAMRRLRAFAALLSELNQKVEADAPPQEIVEHALVASGYLEHLEKQADEESRDRLENLVELIAAATQRADEGKSLVDFLDEMALTSDADGHDADGEHVSLMTLHAAKGLEFDVVFIVGMEERTFPTHRAYGDGLEDAEAMSEERRLCYVGFTRARHRLVLSHADSRFLMGQRHVRSPSRFLLDLPERVVERYAHGRVLEAPGGAAVAGFGTGPLPTAAGGPLLEPELGDEDGIVVDYAFDQRPPEERGAGLPAAGRRVRHRTFGVGEIRRVEGRGPQARLLVHFDGVGTKKILARYVEVM